MDIRKRESRSFVVCLPPARFGSLYSSVRDNISNRIFPFSRRGNLPLIRPFEEIKKRGGGKNEISENGSGEDARSQGN